MIELFVTRRDADVDIALLMSWVWGVSVVLQAK
jgi:hypothetical protein